MAERLYFLAYFMRRALRLGGPEVEDDEEECCAMRSRTMAETQRRWSSDWEVGGAIMMMGVGYEVVNSWLS